MALRRLGLARTVFSAAAWIAATESPVVAVPSYSGGTYSENFNSLPFSPTNTNTNFPTWQDDGTLPGWFYVTAKPADPGGDQRFRASSGNTTTASLYSYGVNNSTERALGFHDSNTFTQDDASEETNNEGTIGMYLALRLTNKSGKTLTSFTLTYDGEQWHQENVNPQKIEFSFRVDAAGLKDVAYKPVTALDFTSPIFGPVPATAAGMALVGDNAANRKSGITTTVSGIRWDPETDIWLRWTDVNDVNRDHGLAIDNLGFSSADALSGSTRVVDSNGSWSNPGEWSHGVPDSAGVSARLGSFGSSATTVTLDGNKTVGSLALSGSVGYTLEGGKLTINAGSSKGLVTVAAGVNEIKSALDLGAATDVVVESGSKLTLSGNVSGKAASITLGVGSVLDLTEQSLVIQAQPGQASLVAQQVAFDIARARNDASGLWKGNGITSSAAEADLTGVRGLAVIANDDGHGNSILKDFAGEQVDVNSVLIRYTYNGDANADGRITFDDYFQIDQGMASNGTLKGYRFGDFNYDGELGASDYALIDASFNAQGSPLAAEMIALHTSQFGTAYVQALVAVPEPTTLSVLAISVLFSLVKRGSEQKANVSSR